jgi:hypothetical protein
MSGQNVCFGKIERIKTFRTFVSEKLQSTKTLGGYSPNTFTNILRSFLWEGLLMIKGIIQF